MEVSKELRSELLEFVLNKVDVVYFNQCIKRFHTQGLYSKYKRDLQAYYPDLLKSDLTYSILMCEVFRPYTCPEIKCNELRFEIDKIKRSYKLYPVLHPKRSVLAKEHDTLIVEYNRLLMPQNDLIKLFKKLRKNKKYD